LTPTANYFSCPQSIAEIDHDVLIFWTGPFSTFSDTIDLPSAEEYSKLWNRPILIWDNYPVNDGGLQNNIFLGPYTGRELALGQAVGGIFSNPMFRPNADRVALFSLGKYFSVPDYDPWQAYQEAMPVVGKGAPDALKDLADCLLNNPKFPSMNAEILPVKKAMDRYWAAYATGKYENESKELRAMLERYADNPVWLSQLENQRLWLELKPASEKLSLYAKASLAAMDCLEGKGGKAGQCRSDAKKYLKSAQAFKTKVADNHQGFFWHHFGSEIDKPLFPQFVKKALKK
jgi:hyaluronoglucosaminidase